MNLKTALMALAMGCFVVGCGNVCDEAGDLAVDLCGGGEGGGSTAETTEVDCSGDTETLAQCIVDANPGDCDAYGEAVLDCISGGGGGS